MSHNHKTYSTFDDKSKMTSDEASIRSTSTMSSLKKLLPRKKEYDPRDHEQDSKEKSIRSEARATYFAYR
jgi:hypothetical protein